ncbi:hypothetical protein DID80_02250 [Candidatus Marinamargulisbacteria bacterium SCGC AAA071-K20]|nr:hypothetical protein DID80_02250 [Candidatus Marinamargulisbacteria bacterium SCGC AAA071-K20]
MNHILFMSFLDIFKTLFAKSRSMQANITIGVVMLLVVTASIIISYNYINHKNSVLGLSGSLISQINKTVIHRTTTYLMPVIELVEISSEHISSGVMDVKNWNQLELYFMSSLKQYPQIAMFNYSDVEGNFLMVKRLKDGTLGIKHILNENYKKNEYWQYHDKELNQTYKTGPKLSSYNPLVRPWYTGAVNKKGLFLSDVYTFFTDKKLGITASIPAIDKKGRFQGVIAVDIHLNTLSVFLEQQQFKKASFTYILDQKNTIVAAPETDLKTISSQLSIIKPILDENNGVVGNNFNIKLNGEETIILVTQFPAQFKKAWKIVFMVPSEVLLHEINESNMYTIVISVLILILAIIATKYLTQRITRPIIELTKEAERIKNFNIGKSIHIDSQTDEIQQMAETFSSMETSLKSFQKYVPKSLVKEMVKSGIQAKLGGKKETLSFMFTDVAGFTALSEGMSPEDLTLHLSEYLEEVTSIIKKNKGTIDKYIGDAIMSFWGAPKRQKNHAFLACKAALESKDKIEEMNKAWEKENKMPFPTRIGINTGACIVGNIGSKERLNYTVLGDNVNLASRLEGINKLYGTTIIISEFTYEKVYEKVIVRPLDLVAVKGKSKGIYIYELLALKEGFIETSADKYNIRFEEGVLNYLQKKWSKSLDIFKELNSNNPQDKALNMYIVRCENLIKHPPTDWNGQVNLEVK